MAPKSQLTPLLGALKAALDRITGSKKGSKSRKIVKADDGGQPEIEWVICSDAGRRWLSLTVSRVPSSRPQTPRGVRVDRYLLHVELLGQVI